ncbi:hypothetical protein [Gracilibacillus thailandensis]|uniref:Uncharacterized protein n=1 Tax=Gracilibacillus thailandensis TaxID=563735 RepID=A0A6N7QZ88_9BACI|nr:hypothetical protein [Gracilibacillus thailandensis]MRI66201.1 hypothetical protein [Gracilibacillus thailandensis]
MNEKKPIIEVKNDGDVSIQSMCSPIRKCCLEPGCMGTFVPLYGSTYVFDHCGCDDVVIA